VTGATSGIGAAYARQLAARGFALVLVGRDENRLDSTAHALQARHGTPVETIAADLATDAGVERVIRRLAQGNTDDRTFVSLLVNNAGFVTRGSLDGTDAERQDAMVRLHVLATHRLTQAAVRAMARRGAGAIITVSSTASYLTSPGNVNYCATKAYQRVAMESLAAEVSHLGIYVQAFCPGFTRTELHERARMRTDIIPAVLWMEADAAVAASLAALDRRRPVTVIPGFLNRSIVFLLRHMPRWVLARGTRPYRVMREVSPR